MSSLNLIKLQSEIDYLLSVHSDANGISVTHDDVSVLIQIESDEGLSDYRYGKEYLND